MMTVTTAAELTSEWKPGSIDDFSEGFQTPSRGKTSSGEDTTSRGKVSGDKYCIENGKCCKSAEPSAFKGCTEMKTPVAKGIPTFPVLDDQETPVVSNLHSVSSEFEDEENPVLPTLTPIPVKERHSEGDEGKKGSPTSVLELNESLFKTEDATENTTFCDKDELSIDLEQCSDRLTSIHLGADDIAVRDLSQRAVTRLIANKINIRSSIVASPVSADHSPVSSFECRHVALSRGTAEKIGSMPEWEKVSGRKPTVFVCSPTGRSSLGRSGATSPMARTFTMSPIGRMKVSHPGRGL
jgi:hypothetical protein